MFLSCRSFRMEVHEKDKNSLEKLVPLADPFILFHENIYYAYGTSAEDGIEVLISNDLNIWKEQTNH